MVMMQGVLWKWTNYLSGWQPRWFILDYGVLAYYRSQDEVHLGSRGSVKLSCCEICVHPTDPVRLDLKIPPENHMYLRAASSGERQQWLVALGTAKACRVDTSYQEHQQQINSVSYLKEKMSELNMCRNIIVQQVHQLKSLCPSKDENKQMNEAATMLSATCDSFLSNLNDMMEVVEDSLIQEYQQEILYRTLAFEQLCSTVQKYSSGEVQQITHKGTASGSPVSTPIRIKNPPFFKKHQHHTEIGTPSPSSPSSIFSDSLTESDRGLLSPSNHGPESHNDLKTPTPMNPPNTLTIQPISPAPSTKTSSVQSIDERQNTDVEPRGPERPSPRVPVISSPSTATTTTTSSGTNGNTQLYTLSQQSLESHSSEEVAVKPEPRSFFSLVPVKFEDVFVSIDGRIPTKSFLDACSGILPVFDILGSTTFAPVKIDIQGNIKKILGKYETDETAFVYLQNMIFQELKSNTCNARNSTTDALLWLKRALEFIHVFLAEICRGEQDLAIAATNAYGRSLRKYHGWVVRGVFSLAVKAVPYRKDFMDQLGTVPTREEKTPDADIVEEMKSSVAALGKLVNILCQFYKRHKLDNDAVV